MERSLIEINTRIKASPGKVWRVFTDPNISKNPGGEYVTGWKEGSSFGWKNSEDTMVTNGAILQVEAEKLLKHNLYSADNITVTSIITYKLTDDEPFTILSSREELLAGVNDQVYEEAVESRKGALNAVKAIAEKL